MTTLTCSVCDQSIPSHRRFCALMCAGHVHCFECMENWILRGHNGCMTCRQRMKTFSRQIIQLQPSISNDSLTTTTFIDLTSTDIIDLTSKTIDLTANDDTGLIEKATKYLKTNLCPDLSFCQHLFVP